MGGYIYFPAMTTLFVEKSKCLNTQIQAQRQANIPAKGHILLNTCVCQAPLGQMAGGGGCWSPFMPLEVLRSLWPLYTQAYFQWSSTPRLSNKKYVILSNTNCTVCSIPLFLKTCPHGNLSHLGAHCPIFLQLTLQPPGEHFCCTAIQSLTISQPYHCLALRALTLGDSWLYQQLNVIPWQLTLYQLGLGSISWLDFRARILSYHQTYHFQ